VKRWLVPVTLVSTIIGALVAIQYKSQLDSRHVLPSRRVEDLVFMLKATEKANQQLAEQVSDMQTRLANEGAAIAAPQVGSAVAYPALVGPGLVVTLTEGQAESKMDDGSSAIVHAEDLLKIVNELRTGGAEAVSLNGHRLTEVSEVITAGQHVVINKAPIVAPYTILAIGPAEEMKKTLALRGGVVEYLQFYGIEVKAQPMKEVTVPAADWLRNYTFAKPAPAADKPL
jgi:uncharacterized protein YlxW (UPF0749 family)